MRSKKHITSLMFTLVITTILVSGCGGEAWHADVWPASGTISINGVAPEGLIVELRSTGAAADIRNSRPWGIVDAGGNYTLTTYEKGDGAPAGEYAVALRWPPFVDRPSLADRLAGAYSDPARSHIHVSIAEGENVLAKLTLTGVDVKSVNEVVSKNAPPMGPPGPAMTRQ